MSNIISLEQVDSTNNYAQKNFNSLPDRSLITAQSQTNGKGRGGKTWISSNTSNLYASYIMKNITFQPYKASWIGGLAALYTIRAITKGTSDYWIKWPNDIYNKTEKIAGILCETFLTQNNQINGVIIGIGINVNMPQQELKKIDKPATSILADTGTTTNIESVSKILISNLNRLYDKISDGYIESIFESWKKENALIGNNVEILLDGNNILNAKVLDIESSGKLIVVDKKANIHKIYSGDVSIKNFLIYRR